MVSVAVADADALNGWLILADKFKRTGQYA
jgi:hypothetical protein